MDAARQNILRKYQVDPEALLGRGMEAEVYAYGPDTVFKLYASTISLHHLLILRDFYHTLDHRRVGYALPHIHSVTTDGSFLITVEQRLHGTPMSRVLPALLSSQLDVSMQRYLSAALAISHIQASPNFDRYKLFDPDHLSARSNGDWNNFLAKYIVHKLAQIGFYLQRDVPQFNRRVQQLLAVLDQPYRGSYQLIHGDFFPGNLLIDDTCQITALLDFGSMTMYGDYLFDLATSWVFFDMYDELKANIYERYLALLLEHIGGAMRGKMYLYVLIYSILSANTYSPDCTDGHYQWCVANLCNPTYWNALE